jgi:hypothetical protein
MIPAWTGAGAGDTHLLYKYRLRFRHLRTGAAGLVVLDTAEEMAAESARLEAAGYVVIECLAPIGERPKVPPISSLIEAGDD